MATVTGFFADGWVVPAGVAAGGFAGFFVNAWDIPPYLAVESAYVHFQVEVAHLTEGQIFPTGETNDDDYITVRVQN